MKYGESTFDILYLVIALVAGLRLLGSKKGSAARLMGAAVLVLGAGDAFHLVPRVLNYFVTGDFTAWLGFGKLVTSLTMTVFYVLMYYICLRVYKRQSDEKWVGLVYGLTAARVLLRLLPQNHWLSNESTVLWGVIRNVPFVALGALIIMLFYQHRSEVRVLKPVWLYVTLSFLFYIPVAVAASLVPMLGMLMLPKTVCYILLFFAFMRYAKEA